MSGKNFKELSREMEGADGRGSSLILILIIALSAFTVVWANYAEIDNVIRGEGRVISSVQNQIIQASEGGVILSRSVSENSAVKEGDILFEIDPVDATTELNQIQQRIMSLESRELRLRSEISGDNEFTLENKYHTISSSIALSEESLFLAKRSELQGKLNILEQRRLQRKHSIITGEATVRSTQRMIELLSQEIQVVEPLVKEKLAPATQLLELKRQFEQSNATKENAIASIEQARLEIVEIDKEVESYEANYTFKAIEELNTILSEKLEIEKAIPRLKDRVSRTVIRAPMDGIVNEVYFRTAGGVVTTGDAVLEMVPTGEALIIEARIAPQDISKIQVDDDVRIRFSAYDSAKYGHVLGNVTRISADAVANESNGSSYYFIDVQIVGELIINDNAVIFLPGMTATVDVLSGKRTVFEYIWQPMAKIGELALRD
jgi:membrane fusion protein, adhesin transport system